MQETVLDDLELLFDVLPPKVREALDEIPKKALFEIVLDLGRLPEARFADGFVYLSEVSVNREDIDHVIKRVGSFGNDNRAGIERTLHRISAIKNRQGEPVGLTCRVGRAVFGTIDIVRDFVTTGKSVLLLGRPGVGKTTMLREIARVMSDDLRKRVIIVDTSNEIGGDGDIPHPAIGHSRRMQVSSPDRQAAVMIEAVENHMPEVIVIDEIGTEAEAQAARSIAERGVQLIGTAHGNTLENLVLNPTLSDLIGGIHTVTLSDEEARRRGSQKTVLERKAPPTFDIVIEIRTKDEMVIHGDVGAIIDAYLRDQVPIPEIRRRNDEGRVVTVQEAHIPEPRGQARIGAQPEGGEPRRHEGYPGKRQRRDNRDRSEEDGDENCEYATETRGLSGNPKIFPYGVSRNYIERAASDNRVPVTIVKDIDDADIILTHKGQLKKLPHKVREAERRGVRLCVIRSNTQSQIAGVVSGLNGGGNGDADRRLHEAEAAAKRVLSSEGPVELSPAGSAMRRMQHQLAEKYRLRSTSIGSEPNRRVIIYDPREGDITIE